MSDTLARYVRGLRRRVALLAWPGIAQGAGQVEVPIGACASGESLPPGLLYARGFLLCSTRGPATVAEWSVHQIGRWHLHVDPRVPVQKAEYAGRTILLAGDVFDPAGNASVAASLANGDVEQMLDHLGGRFVLLVLEGGTLRIYHDALGSRSVYYGGGVVASHAALVAEVTGSGLREWVIPFITSRGYHKRDVKYLPGLDSPFEGIRQLTPNTCLTLPDAVVRRYWPRAPRHRSSESAAIEAMADHLRALRLYLEGTGKRVMVGLTGGRDSRGIIAALAPIHPVPFTFIRSNSGRQCRSPDSQVAAELAGMLGLELQVMRVPAPPPSTVGAMPFSIAYRRNTAWVRGVTSGWVAQFAEDNADEKIFVRGFGGEVMRGFYHGPPPLDVPAMANMYDVNAGTSWTRDAFRRFQATVEWSADSLQGYDPADVFYWEHRMGIWGASAMLETDMAFRSVAGYTTRALFCHFMGLEAQRRGDVFRAAVHQLDPRLAGVSYAP